MRKEELEASLQRIKELKRSMRALSQEKGGTGKNFLEEDRRILTALGVRIIQTTSNSIFQKRRVEVGSSFLSTEELEKLPVRQPQLGFFAEKPRFYMPETAGLNYFEQQMRIYDFAKRLGGRLKSVAVHMPSIPEMMQIAHDEIGSGLFVDPLGRHIRTTTIDGGNTLYLGHGKYDNSGVLNLNLLSWEADRGSSRLFTTPVFAPK